MSYLSIIEIKFETDFKSRKKPLKTPKDNTCQCIIHVHHSPSIDSP